MTTTPATADPRPPRPGASPPRPYHFPRFERRTLANGMRLVVAPVAKLPIATALLLVEAGSATDPRGQEGVAQLTAQALLEGTEAIDGTELVEQLELLGATATASADWDVAVVRCTALVHNLPAALGILGGVLQAPAFPEREIERFKGERIADLLQLRADPAGMAEDAFARVVYAEGSRYAIAEGGDEQSVATLTRSHVQAFYAARYRPEAMTIVVAGAMTADEAERTCVKAFGGWRGAAEPPVRPDDAPRTRQRIVHLVGKPDAPQSELRIGHVGVGRGHPAYFDLVVMNAILGGLFSSRINLNLREVHGYTYGAHSMFDWRRQAGPFSVDTAVKSDVTGAAIREVLDEIDRIRSEPVTPEELSLATSYLDGVFPIRYETTEAIAGALAALVIHDLGDAYFDQYRERVRAVTAGHVLQAAREHLHPDALQVVVVGDPGVVRPQLEELRAGPITIHESH